MLPHAASRERRLWAGELLGRGLMPLQVGATLDLSVATRRRQFDAFFLDLCALLRLWGAFDPARAAGAAAAIEHPGLRCAARAAAVQCASWLPAQVQAVIERGLDDLCAAEAEGWLEADRRADLGDVLGLACAGYLPNRLGALRRQVFGAGDAGLWVERIVRLAGEVSPWPAPEQLFGGNERELVTQLLHGPTPGERLRAHLTLAVRVLQGSDPPASDAAQAPAGGPRS